MTSNTFPEHVERVVRAKVASLRREGTVGMGGENLFNMVVRELSHHPRAPKGTNAAFHMREDFNQVIGQLAVRTFIL
jgi:hypothetical protein